MKLPELPSLRALTRELRELHEAWSHPDAGGEYVCLICLDGSHGERSGWRVVDVGSAPNLCGSILVDVGREYVPGSRTCEKCQFVPPSWPAVRAMCPACAGTGHVPTPFDATAAARRLLAAARDGLDKR